MSTEGPVICLVGRVSDVAKPAPGSRVVLCMECNQRCWLSKATAARAAALKGLTGYSCTRCYGNRQPLEILPVSADQAAEIEKELSPAGKEAFRAWHLEMTGKPPPSGH